MHRHLLALLLGSGLILVLSPLTRAEDNDPGRDERLLLSAGLPINGPGLLEFFRQRSEGNAAPDRVATLIKQLGDAKPAIRRKASAELIALGPPTVPLLRQAARDPDVPALARNAQRCLEALEVRSAPLTAAAVRLLVHRQVPRATEALLAFLPNAEEDTVREETQTALAALAHPGGKPNPVLLRALEDDLPLRRASAIAALCQNDRAEPRALLRKLLKDPMPSVRLRAALVLAKAGEAKAVSTLITLLPEVGPDQAREADDFLSNLASEQAPVVPLGQDVAAREKCRDIWAAWWLASEGPAPLEEVRRRTLTEPDRIKALELIKKLGDDSFEDREQATDDLKKMGPRVASLVERAAGGTDVEVSRRARNVLLTIGKDKVPPLSAVTVRLLALRRPPGAAQALLTFLPSAEDEMLGAEVQAALNVLAYREGKASPALVRALADPVPLRRAAAAEALCLGDMTPHREALRKLLKDPEASVRLRVALALAGARDREAVPVLIALVGELPSAQSAPVEEYLTRCAGRSPPAPLPPGDEGRARRREAWSTWWEAQGARVQLVASQPSERGEPYHGYTLLVQPHLNRVIELDRSGKTRWELTGVAGVQGAQVLKGGRVLLAEYNARRVTERNLRNEIVWQATVPSWPMGAQRLRNGHTFVVCRDLLLEVDRTGREVFSMRRPASDLMTARKMRDGSIVCITNHQSCVRLDRTGREIKSFTVQAVVGYGNHIMANGHVLIAGGGTSKVIEYDAAGKVLVETPATQPMSAFRLPNGNILTATQMWPQKVLELNSKGAIVKELATNQYTLRVSGR